MKKKELYIYTITDDSPMCHMYTYYESLSSQNLVVGKQSLGEYVIGYTYDSKLAKMYENTRNMDNINKYVFDYRLFKDNCDEIIETLDPYNLKYQELALFKISSKTKRNIKVVMSGGEYDLIASPYDVLEMISRERMLYIRGISAFKYKHKEMLDKFLLTTISIMNDYEYIYYDDDVDRLSYNLSYGMSEYNYDIKKFNDSIDMYIFMLWVYKDVFNIKKMMEVFR
jgi:hypothetical protein